MYRSTFLIAVCLVGCKSPDPTEGSVPGQCTDGADNDADGYFDCDDNDCWGAPDCKDGGGGGGTDTDTTGGGTDDTKDTDTVEETGVPAVEGTGYADFLTTISMTYLVTFDLDTFGDTICHTYMGIPADQSCNCSAAYSGKGHLVQAESGRNTYAATWKVEASNCPVIDDDRPETNDVNFNDGAIWRPKDTTEAYQTVHFKSSMKGIVDWIAHADIDNTKPVTQNIMEAEQYWVKATVAHSLDNATWTLHYKETEVKNIDLIAVVNVSDFHFAFTEDNTPATLPIPALVVP